MISFNLAALCAALLFSLSMWATGLKGRLPRLLVRISWALAWIAAWLTVANALDLAGLNPIGVVWVIGTSLFACYSISEKIRKAGNFQDPWD